MDFFARVFVPRLAYILKVMAVASVYLLAGRFGLLMAFENTSVSPVWPPTGIALSALLLLGPRYWPAVTLGAFAVNILTPNLPFAVAVTIAVGNTLEAVLGAWALTRIARFDTLFERRRDVLSLLLFGALLGTTSSASLGVLSLRIGTVIPSSVMPGLWLQWWLGDAMGAIVIVPFALTWAGSARRVRFTGGAFEAALLGCALAFVGAVVFARPFDKELLDDAYWLFPMVLWAALRFGPRGVATATVMVSAIAIWGTTRNLGPFIGATTGTSLVLLQAFLGVVALTGQLLGSIASEQRTAEASLQTLNRELEQRVAERTSALERINRELQQTNEENATFVFSVSHDLRSPLVNLQGFSTELRISAGELRAVLSDVTVPEEPRGRALQLLDRDMEESIRFIETGVTRLASHIDALLRLSRAGRVEYRIQNVSVQDMVHRVVASMHNTSVACGATLKVHELPAVLGDPNALEQIFANLIGNALKYLDSSRPGLIEVGAMPTDGAPAGSLCTFWVRDNGLGVQKSALTRVFDAFHRQHPTVSKGEGLGLAIVRRATERHGGKAWVESTVGVGSTFFVSLPMSLAPKGGETV